MLGKMSDLGTKLEKIMKYGGDVREGEEIRASSREGSGQVLEKGWIRVSIGKGRIMASVRKVESGQVPRKGRIRASAGKVEI